MKTVRKVESKYDFEIVESLLKAIERVTPESKYSNEGRNAPTWLFLFFDGIIPVGVAELFDDKKLRCLYIGNFGIVKKFQNKGVGSEFVDWIEKYCMSQNYRVIELTATPNSIGFYEKNGFESTDKCEGSFKKIINL